MVSPDQVEALFARRDGKYAFARWGRPIAPVVFGVRDETLDLMKGALQAVADLAGHEMVEVDPDLGSNLMVFFMKDWAELLDVPDLGRLITDLVPLVARLQREGANQYRVFHFDETGAIKACFVFLCMDEQLSDVPADTLALGQMVQAMLLWSDAAFSEVSPLAMLPGGVSVLRPEIAAVIRAAYDTVLPAVAGDPSHALRLFARLEVAE